MSSLRQTVRSLKYPKIFGISASASSAILPRYGRALARPRKPMCVSHSTSCIPTDEPQLRRTVELAEKVIPVASPNLYFEVPQSVCSIFTGRRSELNEVEESLLSPMLSNEPFVQKRFVIFGIGGSGKTELCRKFAQENRHW